MYLGQNVEGVSSLRELLADGCKSMHPTEDAAAFANQREDNGREAEAN